MSNLISKSPLVLSDTMAFRDLPPGCSADNLLSWGSYGHVYLVEGGVEVIKAAKTRADRLAINIEKQIYERLGHHAGLLDYLGCQTYDHGTAHALRLGLAEKGSLSKYLANERSTDANLRFVWVKQLANTLHYIHSKNVVHGDLCCNNIFLDKQLNTRLGDFAGSSIDGSELLVACPSSHEPPWSCTMIKADIFALGSVYYQIMTGNAPFDQYSDDDVKEFFKDGNYPEVMCLGAVGDIIENCWKGRYEDMEAVLRDINLQGKSFSYSFIIEYY